MFSQKPRLRGLTIICGLFVFGVAATAVLDLTGWDFAWSDRFYKPAGLYKGWFLGHEQPWALLYDYGEYPMWILGALALAICGAVRLGKVPRTYLKPSLVVILTAILGPGLLVNAILKPNWGRPRPSELANMGGDREYRRVWEPQGPGQGRSFTCGHCAATYSLASVVAFYPLHPVISVIALAGGLAFGTAAGIARLVQGGHFPTDIVWSGVLILMLITALYYLVFRIPETTYQCRPPP
jgi:lipid A 4'-phosphatase